MRRFTGIPQRLVLVSAMLFAAGCRAPGPAPELPSATAEPFSLTGRETPPQRWWRSFDDQDLDALIEQSFSGNLDLAAAW